MDAGRWMMAESEHRVSRERAVRIVLRLRVERGDDALERPNATPARLRSLLSDPLTQDQAAMLAAVVLKCVSLPDYFAWLGDQRRSWVAFVARRKVRFADSSEELPDDREPDDREPAHFDSFWRQARRDFEASPDGRARAEQARERLLPDAVACPRCGRLPGQLTWFAFEAPEEMAVRLGGDRGWALWCDGCGERAGLLLELDE